jgi:hypothetical protein
VKKSDLYNAAQSIKPDTRMKARLAAAVTQPPERRLLRSFGIVAAACALLLIIGAPVMYVNGFLFTPSQTPDDTVLLPGSGTAEPSPLPTGQEHFIIALDSYELPWYDGANGSAPVLRHKLEDAPQSIVRRVHSGSSGSGTYLYNDRFWFYATGVRTDLTIAYSFVALHGDHYNEHWVYFQYLDEPREQEADYLIASVSVPESFPKQVSVHDLLTDTGGMFSYSQERDDTAVLSPPPPSVSDHPN